MGEKISAQRSRLEFWEAEAGRAYLQALRVTGVPDLAEEAVQEAFAKLLQRPPALDMGSEAGLAYFLRAVRHTALDLQRSNRHRKQREDAHAVNTLPRDSSPEHQAATAEAAHAARAALAQLPPEERESVSLCCEQDLSRRAAAQIMGLPERTVSSYVQRGLAKLQSVLAAQDFTALTPLAVGEGLRALGVPPASAELLRTLHDLAGPARASLRASARSATRHTSGSSGVKAALGVALAAALAAGAWIFWNRTPVTPPLKAPSPGRPAQVESGSGHAAAAQPEAPKDGILFQDRVEDGITAWTLDGLKAEHVQIGLDGKKIWVLKMSSLTPGRPGYATTKLRRLAPALAVEYSTLRTSPTGSFRTALFIKEPNAIQPVDPRSPVPSAGSTVLENNRWYRWRVEYLGLSGTGGASSSNLCRTYIDGKLVLEKGIEGTFEDSFGINVTDMDVLFKDLRVVEMEALKEADRK